MPPLHQSGLTALVDCSAQPRPHQVAVMPTRALHHGPAARQIADPSDQAMRLPTVEFMIRVAMSASGPEADINAAAKARAIDYADLVCCRAGCADRIEIEQDVEGLTHLQQERVIVRPQLMLAIKPALHCRRRGAHI